MLIGRKEESGSRRFFLWFLRQKFMADSNTEITFNSIKDLVYYLNHIDKDDNGLQINIKIQSSKGSETDGRN